tara:strand:- start:1316 stop:4777 length:3462 start_codon:yes stop_codon:yes gene_type:complete
MANTFLDTKISSFIEDKFPEFVRTDHPVFVEFLKLYYQFMESAKITMTNVQAADNILLENLLTDNFALLEDGSKIYTEDSEYGAFEKGETVTGQTSGATSVILAEDNINSALYVEQNRHFQVGETIIGSSSQAQGKISKYQGNPVQTIQQLLEYVNIDKTISDFFDQFREAYLTAIPNTLASGVSKRNLVKNIRDMYRAKGTRKGHELFFRLLFAETPEIFYPTENILKISAGEWTTDTVIRLVATTNNPANLVGQTITQTIDATLDAEVASATVEAIVQIQEGETLVYQLTLNVDSITGTFVAGAEVTGIDNTNSDLAIAAKVQSIITGANVDNGGSLYTTSDAVTVVSDSGQEASVDIVDVGSGEVDEIVIDTPGSNYTIGTDLYFDSSGTQGSGASAKITNVGGAVAPESGDVAAYGMNLNDHIVYEDATEQDDAYTGNQIQLETQTFTDLGVASEAGEVVNITMFSGGSGYESMPSAVPTSARIFWNTFALSTSGEFKVGETITTNTGVTGTIAVLRVGNVSVSGASGTFAIGNVITGGTSGAKATLTSVTTHGTGAIFLPWSQSGIGSVKGIEVSKFGSGFNSAPTLSLPIKFLLTSYSGGGNLTLSSTFLAGDTIKGGTSEAVGEVTTWDAPRQTLTVKIISGAFLLGEQLTRGTTTNYATLSKKSQAVLSSTIGTLGTTAGSYENDKGKVSESLMKIQDSFYYQDFSYVVRVGSAIADWRGSVKKAIHPAGFAIFGEVSLINQVSVKLTTPVTGITSETPTLASLFEAVLVTVVGRRLGTADDGTTLLGETEIKGTTDHGTGTLKRGSNTGHKFGLVTTISAITASGTTVTVVTDSPHGIEVGELIQITGIGTAGYNGTFNVTAVTNQATFTYTASSNPSSPGTLGSQPHVYLASPFSNTTRDVTLRSHKEMTIQTLYSGFDSLRKNRFGLGATKKTASRYLWSVGAISDTSYTRLDNVSYIYPNITRRQVPETGTDNVTAGNAGVIDSTMKYINIQIGAHEQNVHMTLDQFGDVRIDEIVRPERIIAEDGTPDMFYNGDDRDYFIAESGTPSGEEWKIADGASEKTAHYTYDTNMVIESLDGVTATGDSETIPTESNKLWNVPPPSYIRGVNISTGEYVSFDDNTTPPDFSDNTAPPTFDATSGT